MRYLLLFLGACTFNTGGTSQQTSSDGMPSSDMALADAKQEVDGAVDAPRSCPGYGDRQGFPFPVKYYGQASDKTSWEDARSTCMADNGRLLVVDNEMFNEAISTNLSHSIWIGLADITVEGQYVWENGLPLIGWNNFKSDVTSEPGDEKDCVEMIAANGANNPENGRPDDDDEWETGEWLNVQCFHERRFFCECAPTLTTY